FMTAPKYPELVCGPEVAGVGLFGALEAGAVLVRDPSSRLAWGESARGRPLFASGQSRLLSADLRDLLKLICSADALHRDNLDQWLGNDEARTLLVELVKQGSLERADEE